MNVIIPISWPPQSKENWSTAHNPHLPSVYGGLKKFSPSLYLLVDLFFLLQEWQGA